MVMTLRAIETPAQVDAHFLAHHVLGRRNLQVGQIVPRRGAVTLGGDAFPRDLVIRAIPLDSVTNPLPVPLSPLRIDADGEDRDPVEIGEPERPVVDVLGRVKQNADQFLALVRILVLQKLPDTIRRRQTSGQVQTDTPQEFLIARQPRRNNVELPQLRENLFIDEVVGRNVGVVRQRFRHDTDADAGIVSGGLDEHRRLARLPGLDHTIARDIGNRRLVHCIEHQVGEVFLATVREMGRHEDALSLAWFQNDVTWVGLELHDLGRTRIAFRAIRHTGSDPIQNRCVIVRSFIKTGAAAVRDLHDRFLEQQARFR